MCHQTVSLIQWGLEQSGIPTVSISIVPEITAQVEPARYLTVPYDMGFPLGLPDDTDNHRRICLQALELLKSNHPVKEDYHEDQNH